MPGKGGQQKLGKPIGRYSKFSKPKGFEKELEKINHDRHYDDKQNFYVYPTDSKACRKKEFEEDLQMFSIQVEAHRIALGMKTGDPVIILRSSLSLRELYAITSSFATNPITFVQEPLKELPSLEQQLFEDQLMYAVTYAHPFLMFVFSTSQNEFFLLFNIPIPTDLNAKDKSKNPDKADPVQPATLQYLEPCMKQVQQLSRFYPIASRPVVVVNSFPERSSSSEEDALGILNCSCSNLRCGKTQLSDTHVDFKRCTACKLVMYCSKG